MDENGKNIKIIKYQGMIRSLLFLTASILDIIVCVWLCTCFQACLKKSHVNAVKYVYHYLFGTINLGLWYLKRSKLSLISYSNTSFVECKVYRKNASETCYFLGSLLVSWVSEEQNYVTYQQSKLMDRTENWTFLYRKVILALYFPFYTRKVICFPYIKKLMDPTLHLFQLIISPTLFWLENSLFFQNMKQFLRL